VCFIESSLFQATERQVAHRAPVRDVRSVLPSHAEARGALEEPAQHRSSLQLQRVQQDIPQPNEHSPPQADTHGTEDVQVRPLRLQHQPEVQLGMPLSTARERL